MIELGVWLAVVGLCDLVRAARDATTTARRVLIAVTGVTLLTWAVLALETSAARSLLLLSGWVVCFLLWVFGSAQALGRDSAPARVAAFAGLAGGTLFGVLAAGLVAPLGVAPYPLARLDLDVVVLLVGTGLVQVATANTAVRLLLESVGVPATANEKQLKGGRVLGPMERLFIVGLTLSGELTAAAIVVAAKGLLRFPELQARRGEGDDGPSDVSEYFLIGSFASWLFALAGVGLSLLGQPSA